MLSIAFQESEAADLSEINEAPQERLTSGG